MAGMEDNTVLVLGATGGIGGTFGRRLAEAGYAVRAMHRHPQALDRPDGRFDWVKGDAMVAADVRAAAEGVSIIVHGVNPPGYRDWDKYVLPMLDNTIAAAEAVGAMIVFPGTVYNYGPDAFPQIDETAPQHPLTEKGRLRVAMEERLQAASERGVPVLILRAGDFFGPDAPNNWFGQGMVQPGKKVRMVLNPAAPGIGHQWAYLPDVAETLLALVEQRHRLARFSRFHFGGHVDETGSAFVDAIGRAVGRRPLSFHFPWALTGLLSPFVRMLRELRPMAYLWRQKIVLRNDRLVAFLGREPHTPLDVAIRDTLRSLRCL